LGFEIHVAGQFCEVEPKLDTTLNNALDVFPLLQIILHIETFLCSDIQPLCTICEGQEVCFILVGKVVAPNVVVKAFSPLVLVMRFMNLGKEFNIWFYTLASYSLEKPQAS
jgi:hypothetical protein